MLQYLEYFQYRLKDLLHFRPRAYYRLFELYNAEIFPAQLLAVALGLAILVLLWRGRGGRTVAAILAAAWLWIAWGVLHRHLSTIHLAGPLMAAGFALQGLLLAGIGAGRGWSFAPASRVAAGLVLFAVVVQPLIGPLLGRSWAGMELFGLTPDPTVVATLGVLSAVRERRAWLLLPLPIVWCAVQGTTLWLLKSPDALVLPVAAMLTVMLAASRAVAR